MSPSVPSPTPSPPPPQRHIVIFPLPAQGHTLPLLDLSKEFSRRGILVTIITTPANAPSIYEYTKTYTNINIKELAFPSNQNVPNGCENTSQLSSMSLLVPFLRATLLLQQPFKEILQHMDGSGSLPICVISDFFLGWTGTTCHKFGVPRFVFHGMGVLCMALSKSLYQHALHVSTQSSDTQSIQIPGVKLPFSLNISDIPDSCRVTNRNNPLFEFIFEFASVERQSAGIIVNSFAELESEHVSFLESFYQEGCRAWCVGPILLYDDVETANGYPEPQSSDPYIKWLDDRDINRSVIYVSFGTQADVSDVQLDEVAYGLEKCGHPFIWVVRSKTWFVPEGFQERVQGKGWIIRGWVDQRSILAHRATGGFLSHCGWNSVLESLSMGVPLLVWPMMAEQPLNAKFVVEILEAGLWVPMKRDEIVSVHRDDICDVVKELMTSYKGMMVREKAEALQTLARESVRKGGSSNNKLNEFLECL